MNIVFVSGDTYPDGSAATNRHIAYSKGLVKLGHNVTFVLYSRESYHAELFEIEGVVFRCRQSAQPRLITIRKLQRFINIISSIINGKQIIKEINQKQKIDALVLLSTVPLELIPFLRLSRELSLKVIHERTEYPFTVIGNSIKEKIRLRYYLKNCINQFSGIFVINNALKKYFSDYFKKIDNIAIINMIVDTTRFNFDSGNLKHEINYIAYCGTLNAAKDGVDILVQAFTVALKQERVPGNLKLLLIGEPDSIEFKKQLDEIIDNSNCADNIIFRGRVTRDEIPTLLLHASALALARPQNKIAEGGFPTKLGEYLATGKPVIITDTGEVKSYLEDGRNAFIASAGDVQSFSEKIIEVYSDYERALTIGERGKALTDSDFNYIAQANKLADFIKSLHE